MAKVKYQEVDTASVSEKMADGTYFVEARKWYSVLYHFPIAERSFYIVVIVLAIMTTIICTKAFFSIFPIIRQLPFVVVSQDVLDEMPTLKRLRASPEENRQTAILRYFLTNYIHRRENYIYDPVTLERNFYNIRSQSSPEAFAAYRTWYDASNPSSPFNLYGSQTIRKIAVENVTINGNRAHVTFTETLTGGTPTRNRDWVADIGFNYTPYIVQQDIEGLSMTNFFGKAVKVFINPAQYHKKDVFHITPMKFTVTTYNANPFITE